MDAVQDTLFPLPAPSAQEVPATPFERFRLFLNASEAQGGLIPRNVLPDVLGLSAARVTQLIAAGRFTTFTLFGQTFVTAQSFEAFLREERKTGRPVKQISTMKILGACLRGTQEMKNSLSS
jgi:hypothetical protein